jgi:hypothetical protein
MSTACNRLHPKNGTRRGIYPHPRGLVVIGLLAVAALMVAITGKRAPAAVTAARWRIRPMSLAFGAVKTGTPAQKSFSIKNTGKVALNGTVGAINGRGASDFQVTAGGGSFSLQPGLSQTVTVQFTPARSGTSGGAVLYVTSNAGASIKKIRLTGSGKGLSPSPTPTTTPTATPSQSPVPTATPTPPPLGSLNGEILVPSGADAFNIASNTAELYNPGSNAFDCTGLGGVNPQTGYCNNTLIQARLNATVVGLPNGQILIAGGNGPGAVGSTVCLATAELYNPATISFTGTGSMTDAHCFHVGAALLQNGQVLITGGEDATGNQVATADLYDPASGTFSCGNLGGVNSATNYCNSTMTDARYLHTATTMNNGQVLIAGGNDGSNTLATAELYDPASGTFGCTGLGGLNSKTGFCQNTMTDSRLYHTATLIKSGPAAGQVLIAGGMDNSGVILQTAELFQPSASMFICVNGAGAQAPLCNPSLNSARYLHTATYLDPTYVHGPNAGSILIAGGENVAGTVLNSAELYNPALGAFTVTGNMTDSRAFHIARLITTGPHAGNVLIAGGIDNSGNTLSTAELYNPATGQFTATGTMMMARSTTGAAVIP